MESQSQEKQTAKRDFLPWIFMVVFIIEFAVIGWFYLGISNGTYDFQLWILIVITVVGSLLTAIAITYLFFRKRLRMAEKYGWFEEEEEEIEKIKD